MVDVEAAAAVVAVVVVKEALVAVEEEGVVAAAVAAEEPTFPLEVAALDRLKMKNNVPKMEKGN